MNKPSKYRNKKVDLLASRIDGDGYEMLRIRNRKGNMIPFHVLIAEKALGKPLPRGALVHHANEIRNDNSLSNLVICPNQAYHKLLHRRINAKKASGNLNWRKCPFCKQHDDPKNMYAYPRSNAVYHSNCLALYTRNRRNRTPEANDKFNSKRREKYANDYEYREKIKMANRRSREKCEQESIQKTK